MNFYDWLLRHVNRRTPLGDLARDARDDERAPRTGGIEAWRTRLVSAGACTEARKALEAAWKSYLAWTRKHPEAT